MHPRFTVTLTALALSCGGTHPTVVTSPVVTPTVTADTALDGGSPGLVPSQHGSASTAGGTQDGGSPADGAAVGTGQAERLYQQGMQAYGRGDLQAAAQAFTAAYDLHPATELAFNAGRMYERLAMVPEATRYYDLVLAASTDATQRADITARLASLRDYERRRREDVAQPPPGSDALAQEAGTWFTRGITLYRRHQYDAALHAFEAAHQYVETPELLFNLAVTHEHLGHRRDAAEAFREYIQQRPDAPDRAALEQRLRALEDGAR